MARIGRGLGLRHPDGRARQAVVHQQSVGVGQAGVGQRRIAVGSDRRFEVLDAARQIFRSAPVPVIAAAQVVVVGADAAAAARQQRAFAAARKLHAQGADDGARDLLLDGEHVLHAAVEGLRPEVHAGCRYR